MPITALPALDRTSVNFKANVDTFFGSQLPAFSTEAEAARVEINSNTTSAANSATTATTKAGEALTSANNAATSKTGADTARDAAVVARTAAEAALDSFDDRYLGPKGTAPTLDNDGAALLTGALYWDTSLPGMRSWNGTAWVTLPAATAAAIANTPAGGVTETTVQGAIDGLEARKAKAGNNSDITSLSGLTSINGAPVSGGYIHIREELASGTNGGTNNIGVWQTRSLNTEVSDTGGNATLASNQITLSPGTYRFSAKAQARGVDRHQLRFQNITDGTTAGAGMSCTAANANSVENTASVDGRFTISAAKAFEVQHRTETANALIGLGVATGWGTEVYTTVQLWKEL